LLSFSAAFLGSAAPESAPLNAPPEAPISAAVVWAAVDARCCAADAAGNTAAKIATLAIAADPGNRAARTARLTRFFPFSGRIVKVIRSAPQESRVAYEVGALRQTLEVMHPFGVRPSHPTYRGRLIR
jgi:hypothetical protein